MNDRVCIPIGMKWSHVKTGASHLAMDKRTVIQNIPKPRSHNRTVDNIICYPSYFCVRNRPRGTVWHRKTIWTIQLSCVVLSTVSYYPISCWRVVSLAQPIHRWLQSSSGSSIVIVVGPVILQSSSGNLLYCTMIKCCSQIDGLCECVWMIGANSTVFRFSTNFNRITDPFTCTSSFSVNLVTFSRNCSSWYAARAVFFDRC
jgi:hypothetical protein